MSNREIKFRAWDGKKMCYSDKEYDIGYILTNPDGQFSEPMQFTGLTDRNGKEIYEGDIIKYKGMKAPQLIGSGRYCFVYDTGEPMRNITPNEMLKMEIIGNIYENPTLLSPNTK